MNKYEERQVFDMAKQDIPFLKGLELVKHNDRPDFILKDKDGRLIGLEHFRADVYQVQDKDSSHISGGHTTLDKSKKEVFQRYHSFSTHTASSQRISRAKSLVCRYPLATNISNSRKIQRQYNNGCSYQRITGLPMTNEIWKELDVFGDIDFIIIETYDLKNSPANLAEHYGQYFDKNTPKPKMYPAFSFGLTNITFTNVQAEHREGETDILFNMQANWSNYDVSVTKTMLKSERRKLDRKARKHFDKIMKNFCK